MLYCGDALAVLQTLPEESVRCVVTSPPYWGLRDYGMPGQLGLEPTPEEYVSKMVVLFAEVRRVLRDDGTLWINMGDCYAAAKGEGLRSGATENKGNAGADFAGAPNRQLVRGKRMARGTGRWGGGNNSAPGLKEKDLVGMPWRLAFALQTDGWWLRADIIWAKPNPMPESTTDRPTKAHEYLFLLTKSERYYYDAAAIAEPTIRPEWTDETGPLIYSPPGQSPHARSRYKKPDGWDTGPGGHGTIHRNGREAGRPDNAPARETRNARTVWMIATQPYPEAHFATFPEELARRCIVAGSRPGDTVLDPFGGSGTVAQVATGNGRNSIYIDLNPAYLELAKQRIGPLLCDMAVA
jgi:DNA modification methylase